LTCQANRQTHPLTLRREAIARPAAIPLRVHGAPVHSGPKSVLHGADPTAAPYAQLAAHHRRAPVASEYVPSRVRSAA